MPIAREGVPIVVFLLLLSAALTLAAGLAGWGHLPLLPGALQVLAVVSAAAVLFSLYFFRDPERTPAQSGERLAVSPADGRVILVDEVEEPGYIGGPARRVSIFMNVFDVHVNRFPVSGTVRWRSYRPGKFFNAELDKASVHNEALSLGIETGRGERLLVRQIAGLIARRIVCRVAVDDPARRGERYGMIRFGSRLELYLPPHSRVRVAAGDRVRAGETILAELP